MASIIILHHQTKDGATQYTVHSSEMKHISTAVVILAASTTLEGQAKDRDNAVHGLVLPAHSAGPICVVVPVAGTGCVQASAILLHNDAGH